MLPCLDGAAIQSHLGEGQTLPLLKLPQHLPPLLLLILLLGCSDGAAIQDYLGELTGGRSVPRVFVDGKFIGGADDVAGLDASGQLEALLQKAGLIAAR